MKVEESLNVPFDESPPPTKLSPLVDDDVGEEEAIKKNAKVVNNNNEEDESIEVDEIVNIKESKNHPLDQVIGNLNQRTLRKSKDLTPLEAFKRNLEYEGPTHYVLWYLKGTRVETIVYADSDHTGDYVDRKITSGVCTFKWDARFTSWFRLRINYP
ncbi:hypothetical protein Tco_0762213 [Tanacetum coccineum]